MCVFGSESDDFPVHGISSSIRDVVFLESDICVAWDAAVKCEREGVAFDLVS